MSEPIRAKKKPESYSPKTPVLVSMMKDAQAGNATKSGAFAAKRGKKGMSVKNSLDFNLQYSYLEPQTFIQCFASAFMFLEETANPATFLSDPDTGGLCFGCGSGGEEHHCKKDKRAAKRCALFFLFNTMCGNSALRRRFDGSPTEMQKLIGDTQEEGRSCGSDFVVDFLFGYAGYEYRKCTDAATFKDEIIASIDAGRPVIAKIKSETPYFDLITGYDGDALIFPRVITYDFSTNPPSLRPEKTPSYDVLDYLYIIGDKTARRYTLKDGLCNIRRVMEHNDGEGLWDEYLMMLGNDKLNQAGPEERKSRAKNLAETNLYMYNFCSFGGAFDENGKLPNHDLHRELFSPALSMLWSEINDSNMPLVDAGHKTGKLNWEQIWLIDNPAKIAALSGEVCEAIAMASEADRKTLGIINQAIEIVNAQ